MLWEENQAYQKAQTKIVMGLMVIATIAAIVAGATTGDWTPLIFVGLVWLGLFVSHFLIGGLFVAILTLMTKVKTLRKQVWSKDQEGAGPKSKRDSVKPTH